MIKMRYIVFVILILLASCSSHELKKENKTEAPAAKYTLAMVQQGGVTATVKLPGQLAAYQEVSIYPRVNGYVKSVAVDIGSKVSKGSLLMTLDAPELQQAVMQARERYAKARAELSLDKERYGRLQVAAQTEGAVSAMELSSMKAKIASDSALCNAERANVEMQQSMMGYLTIRAPFDGVITLRNVSPGALVSTSAKDQPIMELKSIGLLRLQVDVPESVAGTLHAGDSVAFAVNAMRGKLMKGVISRKSGNINAQYRAERIEVDVDNRHGKLSAGMYADVLLHSTGNVQALYVPKTAVVTSTERRYVLAVRNGKTVKVDVTTGNTDASRTEIFGLLNAGEQVITNANDEIVENVPVQ